MDTNLLDNIKKVISYGKKTALISFLIGSLILFIYYITHYNTIIYFALFFIITAFSTNGYLFILMVVYLFKKSEIKNKILLTLLLMLLNIPIGIGYFEIGFYIYSSTITN
jgi:hypothetical protein